MRLFNAARCLGLLSGSAFQALQHPVARAGRTEPSKRVCRVLCVHAVCAWCCVSTLCVQGAWCVCRVPCVCRVLCVQGAACVHACVCAGHSMCPRPCVSRQRSCVQGGARVGNDVATRLLHACLVRCGWSDASHVTVHFAAAASTPCHTSQYTLPH
jgi:hypothetical protein